MRNKQLLRSRPYISDIDVTVLPDAVDSTRVNLLITTRDSWTISVDGGWHSEGRTMVGLSDANIFGWGNKLKFNTNFSRKTSHTAATSSNTKSPTFWGSFYTAIFPRARLLQLGAQHGAAQGVHTSTDYEIGLTYSDVKRSAT